MIIIGETDATGTLHKVHFNNGTTQQGTTIELATDIFKILYGYQSDSVDAVVLDYGVAREIFRELVHRAVPELRDAY
jgi:hypothetical protein